MQNIIFSTASELANAIKQKQVSAQEVLEAHLAHIDKHNPALNPIITIDEEAVRRREQSAHAVFTRGEIWGPLLGVLKVGCGPGSLTDISEGMLAQVPEHYTGRKTTGSRRG